jgi:predicted ATPase/DNA-binding winged helix-turn-helix (wHTH) protein
LTTSSEAGLSSTHMRCVRQVTDCVECRRRTLDNERCVNKINSEGTVTGLAFRFGLFVFVPSQRLLFEAGKEVRIGARAFDILQVLIERAGQVVAKDELIKYAWPSTIVEETSLRVAIAALRRVLREAQASSRCLVNVVGRGYSFVAPVTREELIPAAATLSRQIPPNHELPAPLTQMVGRANDVHVLIDLVQTRRLVALVGPGGVGKSTLALTVASQLIDRYQDGARLVDLATISDPALVPSSLATVIGPAIPTTDPVPELIAFLREKSLLLVLDNCEHVITAVASVTESVMKGAKGVHILATSREALGVEGEWQYRIKPLDVPPETGSAKADIANEFPAIQLFVERAQTNAESFELTDANAADIAHICRRLDGIPLAIELVAPRVRHFGVHELATRLDDQFFLVSSGRRTALPRQHTLRATLDWSFDLLKEVEKVVLRRLAVFKGAFTFESAVAVVAHRGITPQNVLDSLVSLADKSLVAVDVSENTTRYRLLNITCAYAYEKLLESADSTDVCRWHADNQVGPLVQRSISQIENGEYQAALVTAETLAVIARRTGDPLARLIADRVMSQAQHFYGDHSAARRSAEHVLDNPAKSAPLAYMPLQISHQVSMRVVLSRILWIEGLPEQAVRVVSEMLNYAASDSPFAHCHALAIAACPIAFWRGDDEEVRRLVAILIEQSVRYRVAHARILGECYEWLCPAHDPDGGKALSKTSAVPSPMISKGLVFDTVATIDPRAIESEWPPEPIAEVAGWCASEILRIQGEHILKEGNSAKESEAELMFRRSLDVAESQNALAWQLRSAMSLAILWRGRNRSAEAHDLLSSVYMRFSEGHETRDLRTAAALIETLQ